MTKFKLSLANTLVSLPLFLQCGVLTITAPQFIAFGFATQLIAMSTQTANQAIEVEYDKLMMRTCRRPLPLEKMERKNAKLISFALFSTSNLMFLTLFPLQAAVVADTIFFLYVFCYTPMKRTNIYNTALGAVVGALPPYLGWAAAGGSLLALPPFLQFAYMFSWQFSHFYGILYRFRNDYEVAGFKMQFDYREAVKHMKISLAISAGSMLGVCHFALKFATTPLHLALLDASILVALYQWGWLPLKHFDNEKGSTAAAKSLKINSYKHFTLFWLLIYFDVLLSALRNSDDDLEKGRLIDTQTENRENLQVEQEKNVSNSENTQIINA